MSKSLCALVHKPGSTRAAFQSYYEDHHAPLAVGLFPFSSYVRNHLVDPGDFGWDTISEFWSDDIAEAASLMDGPIGATMRADEERFMDRKRIAPAGSQEVLISAGARADDHGRRTAILFDDAEHTESCIAAAREFAQQMAISLSGVSLDLVTSWSTPAFPAQAVVWLPGWHETLALAQATAPILRVRRFETPVSQLLTTEG